MLLHLILYYIYVTIKMFLQKRKHFFIFVHFFFEKGFLFSYENDLA